MQQNKVRTYLLYAIGEITLVMIGILLALQVNNWNNERLQQKKSISYHERIIEDLTIFISETERNIERSRWIREMVIEAIGLLESKQLPAEKVDTFEKALYFYYQYPYRNPSLSTVTEMRNNGQMNLIQDLDLRKKLILLEQEITSIDEIFISIGNHVQDRMSYIDQYVRSYPDPEKMTFERDIIRMEADFNAMANDEKLINYLSRIGVQWTYNIMFSNRLNNMAVELKDDMVTELEELK